MKPSAITPKKDPSHGRKGKGQRFFIALTVLLLLFSMSLPCAAEAAVMRVGPVSVSDPSPVSHGLLVLSARTDVALSTMVGNDIVFSQDALARGLNLSQVRYITVRSTPPITDGELLLGSSKVVAGQTISAEHLPNLVYTSSSETAARSAFSFTANGGATPFVCTLYHLDELHSTPTVSMASGLSLNTETHRDMEVYGRLSAYDPDGDDLLFEIVRYPKNGCLTLTDHELGTYLYRPNLGYTGADSFSYVARDRYGNYSASAEVSLRVEYTGAAVTYADMEDHRAYNAALTVTEEGIMSGTKVGSESYFYPEKTVSRVEFLVMAMNAAGIREVPVCTATSFADDGEIPASMKGYVAVAHSMGYVTGSEVEGKLCFLPNQEITRAEAAVMLERLLDAEAASVIPVFADHSEIPVWAADAIFSLNALGIMTTHDDYIAPTATLTRAHTAQLLSAVLAYTE